MSGGCEEGRSAGEALVRWIQESEHRDIHRSCRGNVHQRSGDPSVRGWQWRTARALATLVLYQRGYDFSGFSR